MTTWKLCLILCLLSTQLFAQEQLALRLNEQGIMSILRMAVQYNSGIKGSRTVVVPSNIYKFTIPKEKLLSNPIIPVLNEISDLNMNKDLNFYLNTSEIKVNGEVDVKSLKATIFNSNDKGFDVRLSLNLPQVSINGSSLILCEDKLKNQKKCGNGLKATVSQVKISTSKRPVTLSVVLRLRTTGKVARVSVLSVDSNLEGSKAPNLNIDFKSIEVPRIAIVINGQESELDTSRLKDEILKRKTFLAAKLLDFAGNFIASDVVEMLNVYLVDKEVTTSFQVSRQTSDIKFDEFISLEHYYQHSDFVRMPVNFPAANTNPMTVMMDQISEVLKNVQMDISLRKISTPMNKDIELAGLVNFVLNGREISVRDSLGNSSRRLPKLDLSSQRDNDINLAISEPLINGALDVVNSTGLFQELLEKTSPVAGFSIRSVKIHFVDNKSLVAVVNAQVDLKKLEASSPGDWFKNSIAAWLERNNNNSIIYFPIEVSVIPYFTRLPNGVTQLSLGVLSPFNYTELPNRFNYPSNVPATSRLVKEGVMDKLKKALNEHTNKTYDIDITKFLNQSGVVYLPRSISINQGAYLMMNLDIVDIKFNSIFPTKR